MEFIVGFKPLFPVEAFTGAISENREVKGGNLCIRRMQINEREETKEKRHRYLEIRLQRCARLSAPPPEEGVSTPPGGGGQHPPWRWRPEWNTELGSEYRTFNEKLNLILI